MPEKQTVALAVKYEYYCDECGAEMHATGDYEMGDPPLYTHRCPNEHVAHLEMEYPKAFMLPQERQADDHEQS